jgi:DNA-binding IclR family transcriptional regulator
MDVRQGAYALGCKEHGSDVLCAACAIHKGGKVVAALSFSAPRKLMNLIWIDRLRDAASCTVKLDIQ